MRFLLLSPEKFQFLAKSFPETLLHFRFVFFIIVEYYITFLISRILFRKEIIKEGENKRYTFL